MDFVDHSVLLMLIRSLLGPGEFIHPHLLLVVLDFKLVSLSLISGCVGCLPCLRLSAVRVWELFIMHKNRIHKHIAQGFSALFGPCTPFTIYQNVITPYFSWLCFGAF